MTPFRVSMSAERGLAYWPAMRPTRITGRRVPWTSTRLICIRIFSFDEIASGLQSSNDSAQSPPWSRKVSPAAARASCSRRLSTSHDVTRGGRRRMLCTTRASASGSG